MRISKVQLLKVALFTVVCLIGTVLLGVKLANSRLFANTYELAAEFDDATGVLAGDAVKVAGVDVGRVTKTEIRDGKALVTFTVDEKLKLPEDTTIGIRWRNVLGQRFLYVFPGTGSGELEPGDVIGVERTRDVADIGEFLNRVGPILKAIDPEQANRFLDAFNTALQGNEANVRELLDSGSSLATDLQDSDQEIASLIESADTILAAFASQDANIESILDNLDSFSGVLARRTGDINSLVVNLADVQSQLDTLLKTSRTNIDASIDGLDVVADTLADNKKNLSKTLATAPRGLANYFQTTAWGEWFNVRIIEIVLQDRNSNDIVRQGELSNQHGDRGGGAGGGGDDDGGSQGSRGFERENIGAILRYSLSGDSS